VKHGSSSPIILLLSRTISPYIMLFGLYVVFHGHYSPGGGFQGGAILAASVILIRIALDEKVNQLQFNKIYSIPLASLGVIIFFSVGLLSVFAGGEFLDYSFLPFSFMDIPELRSTGILLVEIGVGLAVMAILISIYDNLLEDDDV
jgi:multicomponent Na+:H+ antiporter subunit B